MSIVEKEILWHLFLKINKNMCIAMRARYGEKEMEG